MSARWIGVCVVAGGLMLSACGEKPQVIESRKTDAKAWSGSVDPRFAAGGWKAEDKTSWDEQMRQRAQAQNEYARASQ